jgi:hypothetical protein
MDTEKTYSSAAGAARDYFGARPGEADTASAFMAEWKQLTDNDKAEIKDGLEKIGYKFKT